MDMYRLKNFTILCFEEFYDRIVIRKGFNDFLSYIDLRKNVLVIILEFAYHEIPLS